jgi:hypothetical protein
MDYLYRLVPLEGIEPSPLSSQDSALPLYYRGKINGLLAI